MKKISMKHMNSIFLSASAVALAFTIVAAQSKEKAHEHKKDILHLHLGKQMVNEGVIAGAKGKVDLHEDQHSKGNKQDIHQDIHIEVKNLEANTSYQLLALVGSDTESTSILDFSTDDEGNATVEFRDKGKSENKGHGKIKSPLPDALNPVSGILELTVSDTNQQAVLTADLTAPDKLDYLLQRDLSTGDIKASLKIEANGHKAKLSLEANKLSPNTQYSLALNGSAAQTGSTDEHGKLKIKIELDHSVDVLSLQSVALMDSDSNVVVSTTLP